MNVFKKISKGKSGGFFGEILMDGLICEGQIND